jgi:hypothetical protein
LNFGVFTQPGPKPEMYCTATPSPVSGVLLSCIAYFEPFSK